MVNQKSTNKSFSNGTLYLILILLIVIAIPVFSNKTGFGYGSADAPKDLMHLLEKIGVFLSGSLVLLYRLHKHFKKPVSLGLAWLGSMILIVFIVFFFSLRYYL